MKVYLKDIIIQLIKKTRVNLGVEQSQPALAIFDHFKGQVTKNITNGTKQYSFCVGPGQLH